MASTYSDLKIELIGTGEQVGTWGATTNTNLGTALEEAIVGSVDVSFSSADVTLTLTNSNLTQAARNLRLNLTGTSGGARNLILGSGCQIDKPYIINNGLADTVTVKNTTGTGVAVPAGRSMWVFNNGTNVVDVTNHVSSLTLSTPLPIASGGTGLTSFGTGVATALGQNVTGSGGIALSTSPTFTTPTLGVATATSVNKLAITAPATSATLTVADGKTLTANSSLILGGVDAKTLTVNNSLTLAGTDATTMTFPSTSQTVAGLGLTQTFTAAQTFRAANAVRSEAASTQDAVVIAGRAGGTSSYAVTLTPTTLSANRTLTLPNVNDTVAVIGTAQTFTAAQTFRAANAIRSEAASTQDAIVIAGRAGGSSSYAITLTPATLSASRTLTLPEPGSNETLGYINTPINSQSTAYTLVLTDAGKTILHPASDNNARTFTIPANSSVAYAIGTVVVFINLINTVTIAITSDTLILAGTGGTGSRTLAANGVASAVKVDSTSWIISGNGLT